jgi:hypothetical protein
VVICRRRTHWSVKHAILKLSGAVAASTFDLDR